MRLIDADALMAELEREVALADDWKTAHEIANVVKYFPTVGGWISVKDRLPTSGETVIVSINDSYGDTDYRYTRCGWYLTDGECWIVDDAATISVEAWMPLPKHYEPPKEDEHG